MSRYEVKYMLFLAPFRIIIIEAFPSFFFYKIFQAGFAGDDEPQVIIPSLVGRPRHQVSNYKQCKKTSYPLSLQVTVPFEIRNSNLENLSIDTANYAVLI